VSRIAAECVAEDGGRLLAAQLGTGFQCPPESAAFLNRIRGHAPDYDDVGASATGHPRVVVLPAALAAGELAAGIVLVAHGEAELGQTTVAAVG
jgi:2-methylcitrate dehydratase PrpD